MSQLVFSSPASLVISCCFAFLSLVTFHFTTEETASQSHDKKKKKSVKQMVFSCFKLRLKE